MARELRVLTGPDLARSLQFSFEELACVEGALTRAAKGKSGPAWAGPVELDPGTAPARVRGARLEGPYSTLVSLRHPATQGASLVVATADGRPQAVLADDTHLVALRDALVAAVSVKHHARPGPVTVALAGADRRTRYRLLALTMVREVATVLVEPETRTRLAGLDPGLAADLGLAIEARPRPWCEAGVVLAEAGDDLPGDPGPGSHLVRFASGCGDPLTGSWAAGRDRVTSDDPGACPGAGAESGVAHLGEVTARRTPGRSHDREATATAVTGPAWLDTALGWLALRKSQRFRLGTVVDLGEPGGEPLPVPGADPFPPRA